jgi:hypothetical protein
MSELKERIINDLKKSGFIKELELARMLSKNGWNPHLNDTYLDKDTNVSREIDIIGSKMGPVAYEKLKLWLDLVIECKKTTNPWVIFSNKDENFLKFHLNPGWSLIHGGEKYIKNGGIFPPRVIDKHFMRNNCDRIGSAFHDAFKEPRETSKIFQAVITACKAAADKVTIHGASPKWDDYDEEALTHLTFYHPIVVVDGPLYEVHLNEESEAEVNEVDWIPTTYRYSSRNYADSGNVSFHCDIVRFEFFQQYLQKVDKWLLNMNTDMVEYYKKNYT